MGILKCCIGFREGDISVGWYTKYKKFFSMGITFMYLVLLNSLFGEATVKH